jgi:hypothetical protein
MVSSPKYERDVTHHCGGPTIKPLMIEGEMSIGIWVRIAMDTDTGVLAPFALPLLLKELNVLVLRDTSVTHLDQAISLETYENISRLIGSSAIYFFAFRRKYIIALDRKCLTLNITTRNIWVGILC